LGGIGAVMTAINVDDSERAKAAQRDKFGP